MKNTKMSRKITVSEGKLLTKLSVSSVSNKSQGEAGVVVNIDFLSWN